MNSAILLMSSVLMTGGTPAAPVVSSGPVVSHVGGGCEGCGSAVALPPSCLGCGSCGTGICGPGDPNPLAKTGLLARIKNRLTPAPRGGDCCGSTARTGLFSGGLLGKLRGQSSAPVSVGSPCCGEAPLVIGHYPVQSQAMPAAPTAPQAMPSLPTQGEVRPQPAPAPMPMKSDKADGASVLPSIPSVPLTPSTGPAASNSKPRF